MLTMKTAGYISHALFLEWKCVSSDWSMSGNLLKLFCYVMNLEHIVESNVTFVTFDGKNLGHLGEPSIFHTACLCHYDVWEGGGWDP